MQPERIYDLLYRLGVTANYKGFFHASYAVHLVVQQPEQLLMITKWLYPNVAKHYHTTVRAVERNVRTVIDVAWMHNQPLMSELARYPLTRKPKAAQFISMMVAYLTSDVAA